MYTIKGIIKIPFYSRVGIFDIKRDVFAKYGVKMQSEYIGGHIKKSYSIELVGTQEGIAQAMAYIDGLTK